MDKLKILFAASEAFPFAKSGGLGDVIGSLPKAFPPEETDVRVVIPKYGCIPETYTRQFKFIKSFYVHIGSNDQYCGILEYKSDNVTFYFLDNEYYFKRPGLYGYYDEAERFIFFCRAVLEFIPYVDFYPDVLHCHDWQTALIPYLYKEQYSWHYQNMKTVFTIHNLKFQGVYGFKDIANLINFDYFPSTLEFYKDVNFMKGALYSSDLVTTVSPTYAEEIKDPYYGENLDGVIRDIADHEVGILNGINVKEYNPQTDPHIWENFTTDYRKKVKNKTALQQYLNLPVDPNKPVVAMITRLTEQKGLDLIAAVIHEILQMELQFVVLGTGEAGYENMLRDVAGCYPDKMRACITFDEDLSRKIYAGSDMFLMPSKFEPCGLSQMIAMRYGSIPIVRETGGLKDTVHYYNAQTKEGNGYSFATYNAHDMLFTIQKAVGLFYDYKDDWKQLTRNALLSDFNWSHSAETYLYYYKKICGRLN
ncbi:glycogen synthase GlgA [Pseudoramibacter sp.]|jgi:starch synthase|uniref:glycogen synthase GlgA n=1 Tax=Pseudoramibacter sp. TaxID=2034862 RepID=UPI0025EB84FA|nr:glycogen synthase GlgA [Pseudoramibacter sp.]MCH4072699.1 glycogen synthase GlgA [Pseudoramibacter sp.]MCH4106470.1 glycogen synthase GlgA [Pseudoramibacter sp.]